MSQSPPARVLELIEHFDRDCDSYKSRYYHETPQIATTDNQIAKLVYEHYGFTEDKRKIAEGIAK